VTESVPNKTKEANLKNDNLPNSFAEKFCAKKQNLSALLLLGLVGWFWLVRMVVLCLADEPVQERGVGEETVLVLGISQLLQESLGVLLGDGVTWGRFDKSVTDAVYG
jgi:hypothetical protein